MNKNQLQALIKESGNSDVDVNLQVEIETKSIAYAILCGMYAKGELTEEALDRAIFILNKYLEKEKKSSDSTKNQVDKNRPKVFPLQRKRKEGKKRLLI